MALPLRLILIGALALFACGPSQTGASTTPARNRAGSEAPVDPLLLSLASPLAPWGEAVLSPGVIHDAAAGAVVPLAELSGRLQRMRVVFVGELHDHLAHRRWQARLIEALSRGQGPLLVGLEMLERRSGVQTVLSAYSRGELEERTFASQVDWYHQWGFDFRLYRPIFEVARRLRLPLVALNVEASLARKVGRGGLEALTDAERSALPALRLGVPQHQKVFEALLGLGHPHGGRQGSTSRRPSGVGGASPRHAPAHPHHAHMDRLFAAQVLRDEVMAQTIVQRLDAAGPSARMVVIAGGGHLYFHTGVNARVRLSRPGLAQSSVILVTAPEAGRRVSRGAGDYLVGMAPPTLSERVPSLGLLLGPALDGRPGVLVTRVVAGAASQAGIRVGDVIVAVDGEATSTLFALRWAMEQRSWGERPVITVERAGERRDLVVHLAP